MSSKVSPVGLVERSYSYKCKFCHYGLYDIEKGGYICSYYDYDVDFSKCRKNIFNSNVVVVDNKKGGIRVYRSRFSKGLHYANILIKDLKTSESIADIYEIKRLLYSSIDEMVAGRLETIKRKSKKSSS